MIVINDDRLNECSLKLLFLVSELCDCGLRRNLMRTAESSRGVSFPFISIRGKEKQRHSQANLFDSDTSTYKWEDRQISIINLKSKKESRKDGEYSFFHLNFYNKNG